MRESPEHPTPVGPATGAAYTALPRLRSGPGVLVVHAWWGLNPFIRTLCDRLGREGFVVRAPDLYHGRIATTIAEAKARRSEMKADTVRAELLRALNDLQPLSATKSIGLVGLSLGAYWALWLACARPEDVSAVVTFYGARREDYAKAQAAFLCHFASDDPYATADEKQDLEERLRVAGREFQTFTYPGTKHWFFEDDRPDAYDASAAALAWRRTLGFLRERIKT